MPFGRHFQTLWAAVVGWVEALLSRGQKKPSIYDLSRIHDLDPHIQDMLHELEHQSDRGAALVAASMVQIALTRTMRCRIADYKDCVEILFDKDGAPLGTFSATIKVARAFGIVGPVFEGMLNAVRNIRNQFAHSPLKIDLAAPLLAKEINKLLPYQPSWKPEISEQRSRYVGTFVALVQTLEKITQEHISDTITIWAI